ncbi:type II toxin-antitoxin system Phd/YefM family antitoxin (plasmid) [Phyllobacterium sp. A18/5-2]|uniref:type II toxin-antitoxin system Phd/YefM family antitoxin n=1 Tax=Phyllobacterium sp. A18/5-2 TaxID=2978392 RepID=UPI0021C9BF5D|nr:type II toxin-antitoxin system Phd/YefM family antitoxin [Phyllobacterium sp. A18/5-2]UXN66970.1 type II toxin-antitoxin system Phd/YefM family antitoxin [Phyllobacterium sp. A18/5-2]
MNISIAQAKARFSELVARAQSGEEIVLTRHGKAVATISPLPNHNVEPGTLIGALKGRVKISDDFNDLGPEWDDYVK